MAVRYQPLTRNGSWWAATSTTSFQFRPISARSWSGTSRGKGIAAAAAVGLARHTIKAIVNVDPTPAVVIGALNRALLEEEQRMCTLAYVLLGPTR